MAYGKTIKIFLMDGESSGKASCELSNWMGRVFRIPRNLVNKSNIKEIALTGVYFLIGYDEETNKKSVYIGEAENIEERLKQHLKEKDFWTECLFVISDRNNLNKAHIKYLENSFYNLAIKSNQYKVINKNEPSKSSISDAEEAEMVEFIDNTKILINTLGYKAFEPLVSEEKLEKETEEILYLNYKNIKAKALMTSEGFVLLKGSQIIEEVKDYIPNGYKALRIKYKDKIKNLETIEDLLFNSPSAAAVFVTGKNQNGPKMWKNKDGKTLKELEEN
ncbi:MAG: GIY-YIG nuclease family protein [Fusobacterium sp. JB019]|nr:GIY-YIG nuclease family protein [Fusobacterium sp. JB019]